MFLAQFMWPLNINNSFFKNTVSCNLESTSAIMLCSPLMWQAVILKPNRTPSQNNSLRITINIFDLEVPLFTAYTVELLSLFTLIWDPVHNEPQRRAATNTVKSSKVFMCSFSYPGKSSLKLTWNQSPLYSPPRFDKRR